MIIYLCIVNIIDLTEYMCIKYKLIILTRVYYKSRCRSNLNVRSFILAVKTTTTTTTITTCLHIIRLMGITSKNKSGIVWHYNNECTLVVEMANCDCFQ